MSKSELGEDKSCLKTLVAGADCRGRRPFLDRRHRSSLLGHVLDGLMLLHGLLPVAAIELLHHHAAHGALVQAVGGNPEASRVRAGRIKALDAAALTEGVLRLVGIEGVRGDAVGSLQKLEARGRDNEVFVLLLLADAAVAVKDVQVSRGPNFKAHRPTVAASCVFHQALVFAFPKGGEGSSGGEGS